MAVFTRVSLVLRGVSVLGDGQTVNPRLDTGYAADTQAPTIGHPMPRSMPAPTPLAKRLNEQLRYSLIEAERGAKDRSVLRACWWR